MGARKSKDVRTGLDWLGQQYAKPIVAAGFSFGAATGLEAACSYSNVSGFAALGLPTIAEGRTYSYPFLNQCRFPKLFLSGDRDQYSPADDLRAVFHAAQDPKALQLIPRADHFFTGQLAEMQNALRGWLLSNFSDTRPASSNG